MEWKRSSRCSADSPQCVEVAIDGDVIYMRDSNAADVTYLAFTGEEWATFLIGAKAGEFDF